MNKKNLRSAIAMIELIFAIVIIGITLMSAPILISQASKSGYVAIQQEGINEAASHISMIMGYDWDESNTQSDSYDTILRTDSAVADINESTNPNFPGYRIGTPKESMRNYKVGGTSRLDASNIGSEIGETEEDDIDDFSGTIIHLDDLSSGSAVADNIEKTTDINMSTSVVYISDAPATGTAYNSNTLTLNPDLSGAGSTTITSNIKHITVTLTSESGVDELSKTIILHAFSSNIGGAGELGWR